MSRLDFLEADPEMRILVPVTNWAGWGVGVGDGLGNLGVRETAEGRGELARI